MSETDTEILTKLHIWCPGCNTFDNELTLPDINTDTDRGGLIEQAFGRDRDCAACGSTFQVDILEEAIEV